MHEAVGEVSPVRHQDETFALFVEPAHVVKVLILERQQIVDRHALMGVTMGADVAAGFVHGDDDWQLGLDGFSIHHDLVLGGHLRGEVVDDVSVDGDTAFENDLLGTTARSDAALAEIAV
jgi:hypothetical protein